MILEGDDTSWENFDIRSELNGGGQGTASHAWSGHPTYFLSSEVLGVNLGFHKNISSKQIIISPQSETLTWAKGYVPHPLGLIYVDWKVEDDRFLLNYTGPPGVRVVTKPKGRLAWKELWINGKKVRE